MALLHTATVRNVYSYVTNYQLITMVNKVQNLEPWRRLWRRSSHVPRGHFTVYVGDSSRRFVVPTSFLSEPLFVELLKLAEEEFGFDSRATGGLKIPVSEAHFVGQLSLLRSACAKNALKRDNSMEWLLKANNAITSAAS